MKLRREAGEGEEAGGEGGRQRDIITGRLPGLIARAAPQKKRELRGWFLLVVGRHCMAVIGHLL